MSDKENDGGLLLTPGFEVRDPDLNGDIRIISGVFANSTVTNPSPRLQTSQSGHAAALWFLQLLVIS